MIAAAAITAAVTASSAIEKICSDRLTGCLENPWQPPNNRERSALDSILSAYGDRDLDGWLARSVLAHKALLFLDQGDPDRAISTYQQLGQLGFKQPSDRVEYSLGLSRALLTKGQATQAIAVLEQVLNSLDANTAPAGIGLLEALALCYATWEKPIPEHWRSVLRSATSAAGIELPKGDQEAPLASLIYLAAEALRSRASGADRSSRQNPDGPRSDAGSAASSPWPSSGRCHCA